MTVFLHAKILLYLWGLLFFSFIWDSCYNRFVFCNICEVRVNCRRCVSCETTIVLGTLIIKTYTTKYKIFAKFLVVYLSISVPVPSLLLNQLHGTTWRVHHLWRHLKLSSRPFNALKTRVWLKVIGREPAQLVFWSALLFSLGCATALL